MLSMAPVALSIQPAAAEPDMECGPDWNLEVFADAEGNYWVCHYSYAQSAWVWSRCGGVCG